MHRRYLPLVGLSLCLGLILWLAKAQEGQIAVAAAPGASWRTPSGWFNPRLIRWFGVPEAQTFQLSEVRVRAGDDPAWARPDWDDRGWEMTGYAGLPARAGVFWARFRIRSPDAPLPSGLLISGAVAYELFWDGEKIGESGRPAADAGGERPGRVDNLFGLAPRQTRAGEHVVALRLSSYGVQASAPRAWLSVFLQDVGERPTAQARRAAGPALAGGALLLLGVVAGVLWLVAARRAALAWFCAVGVIAGVMQGLSTVRWYLNPHYTWSHPLGVSVDVAIGALGVAIQGLTLTLLRVPHRRRIAALTALAMLVAAGLSPAGKNLEGPWIMLVALSASCLCAARAAMEGQRGAWLVTAGFLVGAGLLGLRPYTYVNAEFFPRFLPTVLSLTIALALQVRDQRREARLVASRAARLEIELLKKNIQPHFLMNTLTTLLEAVEQNPQVAAKMIQALAEEFRVLVAISGERLVRLDQELALCRAHLEVMSLQRGRRLVLETRAIDLEERVPPALFHTLIENGLTHQLIRRPGGTFTLAGETRGGERVYVFTAPGEGETAARPDERVGSGKRRREGTGLRYVRARLEESFPGQWRLEAAALPDGRWCTRITVPAGATAAPAAAVNSAAEVASGAGVTGGGEDHARAHR